MSGGESGRLFDDAAGPDLEISSSRPEATEPATRWVEVAVPLPLDGPLTYALAAHHREVEPGVRARVQVGPRRLVGVVLAVLDRRPDLDRIRPVEEILDLEPVLPSELLDLARFVSEYYIAPIGEVLRAFVPGDLPPWGDRRVGLTDAGALAPPRDEEEAGLIAALIEHRRLRVGELRRLVPLDDLAPRLEELRRLGRVVLEQPGGRGTRYVKAVERRDGDLATQLEAAGRSPKGRAVLEYLHAVGRPATLQEIRWAVGCGPTVVRRLESLDLLRSFQQPQRLSLSRHRLGEEGSDPIVLRPDQRAAVEALDAAIVAGEYAPFLLRGVTGSGKTEVYLRAARRALDLGLGTIVLVPEIALVPALAAQLRRRFAGETAILHSNLSASERHQEWERIRRGEARIVLGPRSALMAPLDRLGLIVVDEEHDAAYKQDQVPRYNGRDLALWRARRHGAAAVLASATPSLESRRNAETGKVARLELVERVGNAELPRGVLVDLRREAAARGPGEVFFSGVLLEELRRTIDRDEQAILLRNRRGYAPVLLCRACGEDFRCPDCGVPMTYHLRGHHLSCHYCDLERPAPRRCTTCGEPALEPMGAGTERIEERFRELFPNVAVDTLDADAARRAGGAAAVLERFRSGATQVLVGTQMVSKGHHFPRVSLAAVLFADTYLSFPDFRAVERTYALLVQLAGRAGRGKLPGRVVLQTYHPEHYAIRAALDGNDALFAEHEMRFRRTFHYPPFARVVLVLSQHTRAERAEASLRQLAARIAADPAAEGVRILGPTPAPFERLRGRWRW
ncbi:MAG: primosomal protein N', partial [Acidobacteriota bacterium]